MSAVATCGTCRFFERHFPLSSEPAGPGGCHRFPPPDEHGFPTVAFGAWCGEHQEHPRTVDQTIEVMRQRGLL